jgi:hypothetical protein
MLSIFYCSVVSGLYSGSLKLDSLCTTEYAKYHAHDGTTTDRRLKAAARTYFYMNEAQCERNMETFIQSIEAVSGIFRVK